MLHEPNAIIHLVQNNSRDSCVSVALLWKLEMILSILCFLAQLHSFH